MVSSESKDRFCLRLLGRELAALGLVESRADYIQRWLGGGKHHSIDTVPLTSSLFLSLQFGLMLAQMEFDDALDVERDADENWMVAAKRMMLRRTIKRFETWIHASAAFRPEIEL